MLKQHNGGVFRRYRYPKMSRSMAIEFGDHNSEAATDTAGLCCATLRVPPSSTGTSGIRECKTSVINGR